MKKILFVEDNAIAQKLITEVFGDEYQIEVAGDYVTAMEKLSQFQFDLVVTDIFFPQETGTGKKELAGKLAERLRSFCWEEGIKSYLEYTDNFDAQLMKEHIMYCWKKSGPEYGFEQAEYEFASRLRNFSTQRRAIAGVNSWLSSQDEADQPMGVFVAEECELRGLKFQVASSMNHHSEKLEAVSQFVRSKGCEIFDFGTYGKVENNPKESKLFWEELRKEVINH